MKEGKWPKHCRLCGKVYVGSANVFPMCCDTILEDGDGVE